MADDDDGLFDRLRARLAPTQDGSASPQARDERPTVVGREEYREEVDEQQIETFVREYYRNPLVRVPVQNFASDVTEPGVSVDVAPRDDDADIPTVEYDGRDRPLDEALSAWASSCFIDGFRFDGDFADLLEEAVKDRRGRRGTSIVEHAYDDPRERERLLGLKPLKTETVTAYTREGKAIVLRPDDDPGTFDTVAVRDYGDAVRDEAPTTPAGKTAAIAQFDDIFGAQEREEIPFALDDVTVSPHDADTGELFGRPDSSPVIERARALRKKLRYVDQSVVNTAFGNIIATVETQDAEVVKNVRDNLDVNVKDRGEDVDPETVSATNAAVNVTEVEGQVPDIVDIIQQEIEYVLSAMPTPLYRVGFAGGINRDVTSEQGQDYRDAVKRERRRLESDFTDILERKARELLHGDAHADEALDVDVSLRIRPEASESPLRDEEFDAGEFSELMSALSTAAGPKGGATEIIPEDVIIETLLDMDPETVQETAPGDGEAPPITPPDGLSDAELEAFAEFTDADLPALLADEDAVMALPDETDPRVRETFRDAYLFDPIKHPRNPETGKFVERPYSVPDEIADLGTESVISELAVRNDNFAEEVEGIAVDLSGETTPLLEVGTGETVVDTETGEELKVTEQVSPATLNTVTGLKLEGEDGVIEISNQEWGPDRRYVKKGDEGRVPTEIQEVINDVNPDSVQTQLDAVTEDDSVQMTFTNAAGEKQTTQALDVRGVTGPDNAVTVKYQGRVFGSISTDEDGNGVFRPAQEGQDTREVTKVKIQ